MAKKPSHQVHLIQGLEQVRVLAHPLRLQLLEAFARGPKTTKQAAEMLGEKPTRLYHHTAALERVGLIRLKETRPNRGTVEKHFEAVAERLAVDPAVFQGPAGRRLRGSAAALAGGVLDLAKRELTACLPGAGSTRPALPPIALRVALRTSPRHLEALHRQILGWAKRVKADAEKTPKSAAKQDASLTIAFVPQLPSFTTPKAAPAARKARRPRSRSARKES